MTNKSYSGLIKLETFEERVEYLKLIGIVGEETFGSNRYLNQTLYNSYEWRQCRRDIIVRDNGWDLGMDHFLIVGKLLVHHIIPITIEDIINGSPRIFDPENLILTSHNTHQAIHYSDDRQLYNALPIERSKNDTCPWKNT